MTADQSSAAKRKPLPYLSQSKTLVALVAVTGILHLISRQSTLLVIAGAFLAGPEFAGFQFNRGLLWPIFSAFATAFPFVIIFGLSRSVFRDHWVFYGMIWFIAAAIRWAAAFLRGPQPWAVVITSLVCSLVAFLLSAYVSRILFDDSQA